MDISALIFKFFPYKMAFVTNTFNYTIHMNTRFLPSKQKKVPAQICHPDRTESVCFMFRNYNAFTSLIMRCN